MTLAPRALTLGLSLVLLSACNSSAPPPVASPAPPVATEAPAQTAAAEQVREPDEQAGIDPLLSASGLSFSTVNEAFLTPLTPEDNIDSPASWTAPDGSLWLIATAKGTHRLVFYRGDTGAAMRTVGEQGAGPGQFDRPNGVFVIDDLVLAVERDNRRVQVLRLPDMKPLGSFGSDQLKQPYGLWLQRADGGYEVLVSDAYMDPADEDTVPPLNELGQRFQRYRFTASADAIEAQHLGSFGATDAAGAIRIPESLWGDATHGRLLISEEDQADGTRIKVYGMDYALHRQRPRRRPVQSPGRRHRPVRLRQRQRLVDRHRPVQDRSLFHIFDRRSLEHRGSFAGNTVSNTDGVWLHQTASERFPEGVFYAVHDDQGVAAFDWREVRSALGLAACE